jgi:hypothetical protein
MEGGQVILDVVLIVVAVVGGSCVVAQAAIEFGTPLAWSRIRELMKENKELYKENIRLQEALQEKAPYR